jgi:hypothetical protein
LWDTGPHQDPIKKDKKEMTDQKKRRQMSTQACKAGTEKTKNGKSANGKSAVQETKN